MSEDHTTSSGVAAQFPKPVLTSITAKPDAASIKILKQELFANAISIPTTRGGGALGHLAILMSPAAYLAQAHAAFVVPAHPGLHPVHGDPTAAARIAETNRAHAVAIREFTLYTSVSNALRQCLIAAVHPIYFVVLNNALLGHANNTPLMLLDHLDNTYGTVTAQQLDTNILEMMTLWTTDKPIEALWTQVRIAQQFALPHDPISDDTAIRSVLANLGSCGGFEDAVSRWYRLPVATRTLATLQTHFNEANEDRLRSVSARQAGYHAVDATLPPALAAAATAAPPTGAALTDTTGTAWYYCWTHGLGNNALHTSANCDNRGDGHRVDATLANRRQGSNVIMGGGPPRPGARDARNNRRPPRETPE